MKLDPYITFQQDGKFCILQTAFPNYISEILRMESDAEILNFDFKKYLGYAMVPGYRMVVVFVRSLEGNRMLFYAEWKEEMQKIVGAMADFYLRSRIAGNEKKFKNWLIK